MITRLFDSDVIYQLDSWKNAFSTFIDEATCDAEILYNPTRVRVTNIKAFQDGVWYIDDDSYELNLTDNSNTLAYRIITNQDGSLSGEASLSYDVAYPYIELKPRNIPIYKAQSVSNLVKGQYINFGVHPFFYRYYDIDVYIKNTYTSGGSGMVVRLDNHIVWSYLHGTWIDYLGGSDNIRTGVCKVTLQASLTSTNFNNKIVDLSEQGYLGNRSTDKINDIFEINLVITSFKIQRKY